MTRNLKTLGLALLATFALSATAAASASATDVFTSEEKVETVTTEGHPLTPHVFEITSPKLKVECTTANFHGTVENGGSTATISPTYEGTIGVVPHTKHCGSALGALTVDMNGCDYVLTGNTDENEDAEVWIECPDGKEIQLTVPGLGTTLSIHSQTPTSGGVSYTNNGGHVDVDVTVEGITYKCAPAFLCGLAGVPSEANNADYEGSVTVHGANGPISWSEE